MECALLKNRTAKVTSGGFNAWPTKSVPNASEAKVKHALLKNQTAQVASEEFSVWPNESVPKAERDTFKVLPKNSVPKAKKAKVEHAPLKSRTAQVPSGVHLDTWSTSLQAMAGSSAVAANKKPQTTYEEEGSNQDLSLIHI